MTDGRRRRWRRAGIAGLTLVAAEGAATLIDARRYPPPGQLVDVGGYRLHLVVAGDHHAGPTVVLEAGMGSFSSNWFWVQQELATSCRVVAYDRAGLGWSDPSPKPRDVQQLARELRIALTTAGIPGPYVLAGHSFGGLCVRAFAQLYPHDVAGIVLVDASHPDQWERWPTRHADQMIAASQWVSAVLARFGLLRWINPMAGVARGLPPRQAAELRARGSRVVAAMTEARQMGAWHSTSRAQIDDAPDLVAVPLFVLGVSEQPRGAETLTALSEELVQLSSNSTRVVVRGATHESLVAGAEYAQLVAQAIRNVIEAAQQHAPVATLQPA